MLLLPGEPLQRDVARTGGGEKAEDKSQAGRRGDDACDEEHGTPIKVTLSVATRDTKPRSKAQRGDTKPSSKPRRSRSAAPAPIDSMDSRNEQRAAARVGGVVLKGERKNRKRHSVCD